MSKSNSDSPKCKLCGESMPPGEEMFYYHGYSGPCPKPAPSASAQSDNPHNLPHYARSWERMAAKQEAKEEELPLDERCYQAGYKFGTMDERARLRKLLGEARDALSRFVPATGKHSIKDYSVRSEALARIAAELEKP
jgi:hypothetical protein